MNSTHNISYKEKRHLTRVPFVTQVKLMQDQQLWLGHVVDISFKGILVDSGTPFNFSEDKPVIAEIGFDNGTSMSIKAEQAHSNGKLYGFRFLEMGVEGMTHLRNIIMLNLGDDAACERELLALFNHH